MQLTFAHTSRLLGGKWRNEAKRIVREHGRGGQGDPDGANFIDACKASYVLTCVERELLAHPDNTLAVELRQHLQNAMT